MAAVAAALEREVGVHPVLSVSYFGDTTTDNVGEFKVHGGERGEAGLEVAKGDELDALISVIRSRSARKNSPRAPIAGQVEFATTARSAHGSKVRDERAAEGCIRRLDILV